MKNDKKGDNMRLDKFITSVLNVSRQEAKKIIKSKKVTVNDVINTNSDYFVSENDIVKYGEDNLIYKENIYIMMNKPKGYVCANVDNVHKTVFDLIDQKKYNIKNLFTVGRLDVDTTGLLLITSDGALAHKLTSPKNNINKVYFVKCDKDFPDNTNEILEKGVLLKDKDGEEYLSKPSSFEKTKSNEGYITVSEGKFHEVKRLCLSLGLKVTSLHRVKIGNIVLDDSLNIGEYKEINEIKL